MKASLPEGYRARPATLDDVPSAADLINRFSQHVTGNNLVRAESLRADWEGVEFDPASSVMLVEDSNQQLVGTAEVWDTDAMPVSPDIWGNVDPEHERLGIGTYLLEWGIQRCGQVLERVPAEARVDVRVPIHHAHQPSIDLLADHGFELARHFWRMVIELDQDIQTSPLPEGLQLRPFNKKEHAETLYRAEDEAFKDHYGHVEEPFEEGFRRWSGHLLEGTYYDPSLIFVAWDGDEIAGVSICRDRADEDPDMGWIRNTKRSTRIAANSAPYSFPAAIRGTSS